MSKLTALAILVMAGAVCRPVKSSATIYNIAPYTLDNGYSIDGGFIETNGTIGNLAEADILDYEIIVDGAFPYLARFFLRNRKCEENS